MNFSVVENIEKGTAWVKNIKELAWSKHRREIGTFTYSYAVVRDTEKEAMDYYNYYMNEKGDWEAANNVCKIHGIESGSYSPEYFDQFRAAFIAGWGGYPLIGTPEQVTDELLKLRRTGIDGTLVSMVDYNQELPYWNERVMPLLEQAGLRKPHAMIAA